MSGAHLGKILEMRLIIMTSRKDIEKTIANFGDRKSEGKWREFVEKNNAADAELKKLVKFGVENSSTPVSKAQQGSKQHKIDVVNYIDKVVADNEPYRYVGTKKVPVALKFASPKQVGQLAQRLEENRQRMGDESTWDSMKRTANTPQEKKEIRDIIQEDYKKHGAKDMADSDLKWIGKSKYKPLADFKIDAEGISDSVNTYINAQRKYMEPVRPPPKEIDPDLNSGLAALLGGTDEF